MENSPEAQDGEQFTGGVVKKFMYVNRRAPHGSIYAQESLEVVLVGAAFEQDVSVVFLDDGVYQIRKDQDTSAIGTKNFSKTFRALEMYDVEKLYVEKESMQARGMTEDDLNVAVQVKTSAQIGQLMEDQDVVLSF
jgi:tRNA 2-thiouridine synthesizing protein C